MANPRISMRKIKDVLRLRYDGGLSYRQIAVSLQPSFGTVANYLDRAARAGLTWPLPEELSESAVEKRLFLTATRGSHHQWVEPDWPTLHQELRRKGVTLQLLWEEYRAAHPTGSYSYAQFCVRYRAWRTHLTPSLRQVHKAGEKLFLDYCGPTVPIVDGLGGTVRAAAIFVAVTGCLQLYVCRGDLDAKLVGLDWIPCPGVGILWGRPPSPRPR